MFCIACIASSMGRSQVMRHHYIKYCVRSYARCGPLCKDVAAGANPCHPLSPTRLFGESPKEFLGYACGASKHQELSLHNGRKMTLWHIFDICFGTCANHLLPLYLVLFCILCNLSSIVARRGCRSQSLPPSVTYQALWGIP